MHGVVRYTTEAVAEEKIGCGNNCIMQTRSNAGDAAIEGYRAMQMVDICSVRLKLPRKF